MANGLASVSPSSPLSNDAILIHTFDLNLVCISVATLVLRSCLTFALREFSALHVRQDSPTPSLYCPLVVLYLVGRILRWHCSEVTLQHWISKVGYDLVRVDPSHLSGARPSVLNLSMKSVSLKAVDQSELQSLYWAPGDWCISCLLDSNHEMHQEQHQSLWSSAEINSSFTLQWDSTVSVLLCLFFVLLYTVYSWQWPVSGVCIYTCFSCTHISNILPASAQFGL